MQSLFSYTSWLSRPHTSLQRLRLASKRQMTPRVILEDAIREVQGSTFHPISCRCYFISITSYTRLCQVPNGNLRFHLRSSILLAMSPHRCRPRWKSTGNSNLSLLTDRHCDRRWTCISAAAGMPNAPNAIMIFGLPCLSRLGHGNGLAKVWVLT
jgi:hypothetical protein